MLRAILTSERGDATVWLVDLDAPADDSRRLLSSDEEARACRFVSDTHRSRFVACRAALRYLLGARLGVRPEAVTFEYGPAGKPALAGFAGPHFNVSHSGDQALIAVADAAVGVDIELVRPMPDLDALAERLFTADERAALAVVREDARLEAFFAAWTRKEAYIKACGDGIGSASSVEVTLVPDEPARLLSVAGDPAEASRWSLRSLSPRPGFAGAVCLQGPDRAWRPL